MKFHDEVKKEFESILMEPEIIELIRSRLEKLTGQKIGVRPAE